MSSDRFQSSLPKTWYCTYAAVIVFGLQIKKSTWGQRDDHVIHWLNQISSWQNTNQAHPINKAVSAFNSEQTQNGYSYWRQVCQIKEFIQKLSPEFEWQCYEKLSTWILMANSGLALDWIAPTASSPSILLLCFSSLLEKQINLVRSQVNIQTQLYGTLINTTLKNWPKLNW